MTLDLIYFNHKKKSGKIMLLILKQMYVSKVLNS